MCGRLLATAGQDNLVRIWVLQKHLHYFQNMREKYNQQASSGGAGTSHSDFERINFNMDKVRV